MKKKLLLVLFLGVFLFSTAGVAGASFILDFENEGFANNETLNGTGYGGFIWDANIFTLHESVYQSAPHSNPVEFASVASGDLGVAAFNAWGTMSVAISKGYFDFVGGWFTTFSENDTNGPASSATITITGYAGATLVGSHTYNLTNGFVEYKPDLLGIDRLVFESDGIFMHSWIMDDLEFANAGSLAGGGSPVPEPATMLLLCTGLAAVIGLKKRIN